MSPFRNSNVRNKRNTKMLLCYCIYLIDTCLLMAFALNSVQNKLRLFVSSEKQCKSGRVRQMNASSFVILFGCFGFFPGFWEISNSYCIMDSFYLTFSTKRLGIWSKLLPCALQVSSGGESSLLSKKLYFRRLSHYSEMPTCFQWLEEGMFKLLPLRSVVRWR